MTYCLLKSVSMASVGFLALIATLPARADQIYITDFTKNHDIYNALNQQFPNTGAGTPGYNNPGPANATYLYNPAAYTSPNFIAGSDKANNGINFTLASNSSGYDYYDGLTSGQSLTVPINLSNVGNFYTLQSAYNGTSENVTFTGADGHTETFSNISLPDFNGGAGSSGISNCSPGVCAQTALIVHDIGGGGTGNSSNGAYNYYDLTEVSFTLDSILANEEVTSVTFHSNGNTTLLLGMTAQTPTFTPVPEPASLTLLATGLAGLGFFRRRRRPV